jgi:hypothetical protein
VKDPNARLVFENAAQHLRHAGFSPAEMGHLLGGMSPARALALADAAELRQPKLCKGQCVVGSFPMCPYCGHQLQRWQELVESARIRRN